MSWVRVEKKVKTNMFFHQVPAKRNPVCSFGGCKRDPCLCLFFDNLLCVIFCVC